MRVSFFGLAYYSSNQCESRNAFNAEIIRVLFFGSSYYSRKSTNAFNIETMSVFFVGLRAIILARARVPLTSKL